jgi:hypothetical protein
MTAIQLKILLNRFIPSPSHVKSYINVSKVNIAIEKYRLEDCRHMVVQVDDRYTPVFYGPKSIEHCVEIAHMGFSVIG